MSISRVNAAFFSPPLIGNEGIKGNRASSGMWGKKKTFYGWMQKYHTLDNFTKYAQHFSFDCNKGKD